MIIREQFYNKMYDYRCSIKYLELYLNETVKYHNIWRIVIAVTSCSAIACWTKWTNLSYLWGVIIVASEVASVILEYLPYDFRKKELFRAVTLKTPIVSEMEHDWNEILINSIADSEINDLLLKYKKRWDSTENRLFENTSLSPKTKLMVLAQTEIKTEYDELYGGNDE